MKCFSLFSGIGGFDLAAKRLGHEIVGACEIDKYARQVYAKHFPGVRIYEDATKIKPEELPDFDIIVAGFPCQAFSIAAKRLGFEESRGTLFFEIARIVKQKRPRLLLLENVKGLLSHDGGKTFAVILATLDELGYDAQWQVLNSKYFVPQNRERIFIIGHLRGTPRPKIFPIRESSEFINERTTEKQIANSLQCPGHSCGNYKGMTMIYMSQKNANMKKRIQTRDESWCLTNNSNDFGLIQVGNIDQKGHNSLWGRVYDPTGVASNLNAHGGGLGAKTGLYQIGDKVRRLTPKECERLQGFPDDYTKGISDTQRYKCLGNAVTVPVVQYILEKMK